MPSSPSTLAPHPPPSPVPSASPTLLAPIGIPFSTTITFLMLTIVLASLVQGLCPTPVLRLFPTPIVLLLVFIIFGVIVTADNNNSSIAGNIRSMPLEPEAIQAIFLPPLIFSELFKMNLQTFQHALPQVLWLIGPGVVAGAALTGLFTLYLMPSSPHFSAYVSFAFGGMLATTDPISVIISLNSLGAPKRLTALVGGESLLNDGTSIIIVTLFLELASGADITAGQIVGFCFQELLLSLVFGTAMGLLSLALVFLVRDDGVILTSLSLTLPYLTFIIAQFYIDTSGVLSLVPLGLILNRFGTNVMVRHREHIEAVWDEVEFFAMSILYAFSGLYVAIDFTLGSIVATDWLSLFYLYLFLLAVRALLIFGSFPLLTRVGYGISWPEAIVAWWGGLRGAVGLTLAMSIRQSPGVTVREGELSLFFMAGIVVFMVLNGVSTGWLCRKLELVFVPNPHVVAALLRRVRNVSTETMLRAGVAPEGLRRLQSRPFAPLLKRQLSSEDQPDPMSSSDISRHTITQMWVSSSLLAAKRRHLLAAQKTIFRNLLETKLLPKRSYYLLIRALEEHMDLDVIEQLDHWRRVETQIGILACGIPPDTPGGAFFRAISHHAVDEFKMPEPSKDVKGCCSDKTFDAIEMLLAAVVQAAWGYIVCEQHARGLIRQMFRLDDKSFFFRPEVLSLERESAASCRHPALILDLSMKYFPNVVVVIKRAQALVDLHEQSYGLLSKLVHDGLCERAELKLLYAEVKCIEALCAKLDFVVKEPLTVLEEGRGLAANPNFFPFPRLRSDVASQASSIAPDSASHPPSTAGARAPGSPLPVVPENPATDMKADELAIIDGLERPPSVSEFDVAPGETELAAKVMDDVLEVVVEPEEVAAAFTEDELRRY